MAFEQVWNAGHGYSTSGKRSPDGMKEYEFNRAVASYCKELTDSGYEGVNSHLTHSDSRDVPLSERTSYANGIKANCYTSIHANAYGSTWNDANGIETFIYSKDSKQTYALALQVQRDLISATGFNDRGVKVANFQELRETRMTSILAECGFMTNRKEAALLKSDEYRRKVAKALVNSHAFFFGWKKKVTKVISFYTGGFGGDSLVKIHNFLSANKFWYQPSRAEDGTMMFTVGGFGEGTEPANQMENFLKENNYWYQKQ